MFSPKDIIPAALEAIADGKIKERMIKVVISGNFEKKHPTELVKMIEGSQDKRRKGLSTNIACEEERKILMKSSQTRRVIKGESGNNPFRHSM